MKKILMVLAATLICGAVRQDADGQYQTEE